MADRWIPDGTQPPKPLPMFADPLAGLITGSTTASGGVASDAYDEIKVPIAKPVHADPEAAEAMLHAVMDEPEEAPPTGQRMKLPPPRKSALPTGAAMPGMIPPAEKLAARQRVKQALGNGERHPNRNLGGYLVALILLVIFGAIAISVITSVIDAIGGTFE